MWSCLFHIGPGPAVDSGYGCVGIFPMMWFQFGHSWFGWLVMSIPVVSMDVCGFVSRWFSVSGMKFGCSMSSTFELVMYGVLVVFIPSFQVW